MYPKSSARPQKALPRRYGFLKQPLIFSCLLCLATASFAQAPGSLPHASQTLKTGSTPTGQPDPQIGPGSPTGVSGYIWNDANGNGIKEASENYTDAASSGQKLYAVLINTTASPSVVAASLMVSASASATVPSYNFTPVTLNLSYEVRIVSQATAPANGAAASTLTPALATGYTGVSTNNNGTFVASQNTNALAIAVGTLTASASPATSTRSNVNFGIEQLPETSVTSATIAQPAANGFVTLSGGGNPPVFTGSDPEDQPANATLSGKDVAITALPVNGQLWYNDVQITTGADNTNAPSQSNPFKMSGFDPAKMQIKFTGTGYTMLSFMYAYIDAAGAMDLTPATYTLSWSTALPVRLLSFTGKAAGSVVNLAWKSADEVTFKEYVVERSVDGVRFTAVGSIGAKGGTVNEYAFADDVSKLSSTKIYYRLMQTDNDGRFTYSVVVSLALSKLRSLSLTVTPNPVQRAAALLINSENGGKAILSIADPSGKIVLTKTVAVTAGTTNVRLENERQLANGMYVLRMEMNGEVKTEPFVIQR